MPSSGRPDRNSVSAVRIKSAFLSSFGIKNGVALLPVGVSRIRTMPSSNRDAPELAAK